MSLLAHADSLTGSYTPTPLQRVVYGPSALAQLPALVKQLSPSPRVLIVTGTSLATKTPIIEDTQRILEEDGIESVVFSQIGQHAPVEGIRKALEVVKKESITVLVSIGGGSPIDAAKAISYFHHEDAQDRAFLPQVAIPTTLSAAEFTLNAGYSNEKGDKVGVGSGDIVPKIVILDPLLTLHTPQHLFLSSGIRALDHALENLYRPGAPAPLKTLHLAALSELFECLPKCKADEKDIDARGRLQIAAWQSLWLNMVPTAIGLSHSLGHKLGATYAIPHGTCSALTLSPSLHLLATTLPTSSVGLLSLSVALAHLPARFVPSPAPTDPRQRAEVVATAVERLVEELSVGGGKLRDWKVDEADLERLAKDATKSLQGWEGVPGWEVVRQRVLLSIF